MTDSPLQRAVTIAGGQAALGRVAGVSQQAVNLWLHKGRVPVDRCIAIEAATGVTCEELRPDIAWHILRGSREPDAPGGAAPANAPTSPGRAAVAGGVQGVT